MAVRWNISVTTVLLMAVVIFGLPLALCNSPRIASHSSLYSAIDWLKTHSYTAAEPTTDPKPDNLPPAVKENATATVSGQSYWIPESEYAPGDTLEVELSVVELVDETAWVKVTIDSVEVKWVKLEHYRTEVQRKWTLYAEIANVSQDGNDCSQYGIGVGYKLFNVLGSDIVPSASVSTSLDWIAGEVRLSRNIWSGVSVGGGVGGRLIMVEDELTGELHLSASIGIEL